jgi:hypothetical protein
MIETWNPKPERLPQTSAAVGLLLNLTMLMEYQLTQPIPSLAIWGMLKEYTKHRVDHG